MTIAHLKITLEGIAPVVSRTLEVSTNIRLERLHLVIQGAMGWENCHLYEFMAGQARWSLPDPDFGTDALPVAKARLPASKAAYSGPRISKAASTPSTALLAASPAASSFSPAAHILNAATVFLSPAHGGQELRRR